MTEWKTYRAEDYCLTVTDGTHDSPKPQAEGRYLITSKHLKPSGIDFSSANKICEEDYQKIIQRSKVEQYDILFSMIGTVGNIHRVTIPIVDFAVKNMGIFKMGGDANKSLWMYYWLQSPIAQEYIQSRITGSTQGYLTLGNLRDFPVCVPPLEDQRRIAGILGAIDDKIENNRRINTNLELQAQALYKQWFVDNRSDDWEVGKVSDYYDITIGKTPPRKEKQWFSNNPKDSVWVSISDLGSCGAYISDSSEYLTTKAVDKFNIKVVPNNTVLLSFKLTVGRVAITDGVLTTNEAIAHFNTLNDYITEYTYLALKAYNFANLGSTSSIATAVNSKIIKAMPWVMPNDNVLRDFHNIVAPIFTQIKNNIRENETLATHRDTLLPKLMNGEIKL